MMDTTLGFLLVSILFALLDLAGLILACAFHRRWPTACNFVIAATLLNFITRISRIGVQTLWFQHVEDPATFSLLMSAFSMTNWIAYALILAAVFSSRKEWMPQPWHTRRQDRDDDDTAWEPPIAPSTSPKTSEGTGIEEHK